MMAVVIPSLCLLVALIALIVAVESDIKSFVIPNKVSLVVMMSFIPYGLFTLSSADFINHGLSALIVFAVTFLLYLTKNFGAGDVKLLTALSLWAGPLWVIPMIFWVALTGGAVALIYMMKQKKEHTHKTKIKIPYGVAIAAGGIFVLAQNSLTVWQTL